MIKSKKIVIALALLAATAGGVGAQDLTSVQSDQVIARVGDEVVTAGEFARDMQMKIRQMESATGQKVNPDLRFRRALLNEVVNNRILSIVARNAGTVVPEEDIQKEFENGKQMFDSEEAYQGYLKRLNLTEDALKENIRSRLRVTIFVDKETGDLTASDDEVAKLYDTFKAQGKMTRREKTRDIAVILLRARGGSDEDWRGAETRAKEARARIEAGETFDAVARETSEDPTTAARGGLLREMKIGSFYPELEAAMATLKPGDVSEPVRGVMGWYLITIVEEKEPGTIELDSVRELLHAEVIENKRREKISEIINDAQKLIRVELVEVPQSDTPLITPAEPLTPPTPAPQKPDVPLPGAEPLPPAPDGAPALPAPS